MTTAINLDDIFAYDLPAGADLRKLAGDWMDAGYINNLGRPTRLEIVVIGEQGYVVGPGGYLLGRENDDIKPIVLDADGAFPVSLGGIKFSPDDGEMARVGLA